MRVLIFNRVGYQMFFTEVVFTKIKMTYVMAREIEEGLLIFISIGEPLILHMLRPSLFGRLF